MLFGCHVSIASGLAEAVDYAADVGCECMQIFAKSPRQWHSRHLAEEEVARFRDEVRARSMGPVFTHTAYLLNLATPDRVLRRRSAAALADELARGAALGAEGVVTHIGTDPDGDSDAAVKRVSDSVARAFDVAGTAAAGMPLLLLENTAGAGTTFGGSMGDICRIVERAREGGLPCGICLDTCHAHAFGYDVATDEGWSDLLREIDDACGMAVLRVIHANDCVAACGEHRDRHAWIGDGLIGTAGFAAMVARPELATVSVVTEMPGAVPSKDVENLRRLRVLRQG